MARSGKKFGKWAYLGPILIQIKQGATLFFDLRQRLTLPPKADISKKKDEPWRKGGLVRLLIHQQEARHGGRSHSRPRP